MILKFEVNWNFEASLAHPTTTKSIITGKKMLILYKLEEHTEISEFVLQFNKLRTTL